MLELARSTPTPSAVLALSRRIWNLRARLERGEQVELELEAALADRDRYRRRSSN